MGASSEQLFQKGFYLCASLCLHIYLCLSAGVVGLAELELTFSIAVMALSIPSISRLGVGKILGGDTTGQLTQINLSDIPYHRIAAQIQKLRKRGGIEE